MWESIVDKLQDLVVEYGPYKLVAALATLFAVVLGLGAAANPETVLVMAGIFVILVLLLACLALIIDRRRLYRADRDKEYVLDRYGAELVSRQTSGSFEITEWYEEQHIHKKGNTDVNRWFTLTLGEPLQTFCHKAYMTTNREDFEYRKKFRVEARTFEADTRQLGVRLPVTHTWDHHCVSLFVHLNRLCEAGEEVRLHVKFYWPEFTRELVDRYIVDPTEWKFHRKVGDLVVKIFFDKTVRIRRDLTVTRLPGTPALAQHSSRGEHTIEFSYPNPPQDTDIGFSLERRR